MSRNFLSLLIFLSLWISTLFAQKSAKTKTDTTYKGHDPDMQVTERIEAKRWTLGFSLGAMHYYGDIGNEVLPLNSTRMGYAFNIRYLLNAAFSVQGHLGYGHISGDDRAKDFFSFTGQVKQRNFPRGLSFRSHIFESSVSVMYIFGNKNVSYSQLKIVPYLYGGIGFVNFKPKADLFTGTIDYANRYVFKLDSTLIYDANGKVIEKDGEFETELREWRTEGQIDDPQSTGQKNIYKYLQICVPVGMGVKFKINNKLDLLLDVGMRYTLTDYLDDVSSSYQTADAIKKNFPNPKDSALASYISNPTGWLPADGSMRRGNDRTGASRLDLYSFSSLGIAYKFGKKGLRESFDWVNPITYIFRNVYIEHKKLEVIQKKFADLDTDGIIDSVDKCPFTPFGVPVDKNGCPLDDDGDGVANYMDKEANTPKGTVVSFDGIGINMTGGGEKIVYINDCASNFPQNEITLTVSGYVVDSETKAPLPNAIVSLNDKGNNRREALLQTNEHGFYRTIVKADKNYSLTGTSENYLPNFVEASTRNKSKSEDLRIDIPLSKVVKEKAIRLDNIYYDYDKAILRPESATELDRLVSILEEDPSLRIELSSHTDSKGSDEYNMSLSQARAKSVMDYLIAKGVERDRLAFRGYGETKPVAPNENPDGTDNPEGRQKNRRTEFKVTGTDYVPAYVKYAAEIGDTQDSVAKKFNMTATELRTLNKLSSGSLSPGQVLKIRNPDKR